MVKQILFDVRAVDHAASLRAAGFDTRAKCRLISIARFGPGLQRNPLMELIWGRMSAFGTKRTFLIASAMSAFGGKADIVLTVLNVCFLTPSGHSTSFALITL